MQKEREPPPRPRRAFAPPVPGERRSDTSADARQRFRTASHRNPKKGAILPSTELEELSIWNSSAGCELTMPRAQQALTECLLNRIKISDRTFIRNTSTHICEGPGTTKLHYEESPSSHLNCTCLPGQPSSAGAREPPRLSQGRRGRRDILSPDAARICLSAPVTSEGTCCFVLVFGVHRSDDTAPFVGERAGRLAHRSPSARHSTRRITVCEMNKQICGTLFNAATTGAHFDHLH